jgi:cytochrome bd-type quinol oxidase subunit 1
MDYPIWYVPYLTAPLLIPLIAVPHVIVAQFAVGGGILLAELTRRAYRDNQRDQRDVLAYLHRLTQVFVLITLVFGAVTGVGIWWTIGLTSPETTSALIHIFVFGWAAEWAVFVLELASAFVFYYFWSRLAPRDHVVVGWIYAASAWVSLVLITAITSFMLTSGGWSPEKSFFAAFFNPSFLPQVLLRTGGSLAIAALGIAVHLSFQAEPRLSKNLIMRAISRWALIGIVLILAGGLWYLAAMPEHAKLNLIRAPILVGMTAVNLLITLVVMVALAWGHFAGSRWITPPAATLLLLAGAAAITTGEFVREGTRKPYRIDHYVMAPGVRVGEIEKLQREGLIRHSRWLKHYLDQSGSSASSAAAGVPAEERQVRVGQALFRYHCSSCHAEWGYNGIVPLLRPWTPELIRDTVQNLHRANPAMPPWIGNRTERDALAVYLIKLNEPLKKR